MAVQSQASGSFLATGGSGKLTLSAALNGSQVQDSFWKPFSPKAPSSRQGARVLVSATSALVLLCVLCGVVVLLQPSEHAGMQTTPESPASKVPGVGKAGPAREAAPRGMEDASVFNALLDSQHWVVPDHSKGSAIARRAGSTAHGLDLADSHDPGAGVARGAARRAGPS